MQARKTLKRILCITIPIFALVLLWFLQALLVPKYADEENREGGLVADYYELTGESHDVLFLGDCETYESYTPPTLFEEYGITSVIRGTPQQLIWHSYYILQDTLRYETPKVVVLNVYAMRYGSPQKEAYNRLTLDNLKWSRNKIEAIQTSMTDEETFASYLFPLLRYHGRWSEINSNDFKYLFSHKTVSHNGYLMQTGVKAKGEEGEPFKLANTELPDMAWEYLEKIRAVCEEKEIELVLVKAPTNSESYWWYDEWEEQICDYAEENGLKYYNFIPHADEIGIDWSTDTYDGGVHLNVSGAEKLTSYFGKILSEDCGLPDHRNDAETVAIWNAKLDAYNKEKEERSKSE